MGQVFGPLKPKDDLPHPCTDCKKPTKEWYDASPKLIEVVYRCSECRAARKKESDELLKYMMESGAFESLGKAIEGSKT